MIEKIEDAMEWIYSQKSANPRKGLEKIQFALSLLGNPHKKLKTIHIGGTNGKGSTVNYLESLFLSHQMKVGTFTSPHLMTWNERIKVNGKPISDQDLIDLTKKMVSLNDRMARSIYGRLAFFELYTVMMLAYFGGQNLDLALIEVGLGGRLDATNVIESAYVAITSIGFDHLDRLGHQISQIAFEKAGIIHKGAQVWTGPLEREAWNVVEKRSAETGARLYSSVLGDLLSYSIEGGQDFKWQDKVYHLSMLGRHQVENASLALQVFQAWMKDHQYPVSYTKMKVALAQSHWMGRLEKVRPHLFLDGAHNAQGLQTLKQAIEDLMIGEKVAFVYSGLKTKDQLSMMKILKQMPVEAIYLTHFDYPEASQKDDFVYWLDLDGISLNQSSNFFWCEDWQEALEGMIHQYDRVIVTGSLYFIGQVREFLLK